MGQKGGNKVEREKEEVKRYGGGDGRPRETRGSV